MEEGNVALRLPSAWRPAARWGTSVDVVPVVEPVPSADTPHRSVASVGGAPGGSLGWKLVVMVAW